MPETCPNSIKLGVKNRPMGFETKSAVSVTQMARMVNLSRQRFHQLVGTVFPCPLYDVESRRPFYPEELQLVCLEVRRKNVGLNGQVVLFYSCRMPTKPTTSKKRTPNVQKLNVELLEGLKSLGLVVNLFQVEAAIKTLFPRGIEHVDQGEVVRSVFIHLKAKAS
jgi:hypothetical protein